MISKKPKTLSKSELIVWLRKNISPQLNSIQDLGTGAEFCLGIEILFPGSINLEKIKFGEKTEDGRRRNFRYLQNALNNMNININIPIENLIKGSFKYNLYFGQWFKDFFEKHYKYDSYDITTYESLESNESNQGKSYKLSKKVYKNDWSMNVSEDVGSSANCIAEGNINYHVINEPKLIGNTLAITYTEYSNDFNNNPDPQTLNSRNTSPNPNSNTSLDDADSESEDMFQPTNKHMQAEYKSYKFVLRALERNIQHLQQENKKLKEENIQVKEENKRLRSENEANRNIKAECRMMASLLDRFREYH